MRADSLSNIYQPHQRLFVEILVAIGNRYKKGVAGIYPLGSMGEGPLSATDERMAVAKR